MAQVQSTPPSLQWGRTPTGELVITVAVSIRTDPAGPVLNAQSIPSALNGRRN